MKTVTLDVSLHRLAEKYVKVGYFSRFVEQAIISYLRPNIKQADKETLEQISVEVAESLQKYDKTKDMRTLIFGEKDE